MSMNRQLWKAKFIATGLHFLVTLALAACAAALIFLVWFPDPFQKMMGGTELFLLVIGCDLALGPLISLVIYNPAKSRRELILDYSLAFSIQIAALIYGVWVVSASRPIYVVFCKDRLEVVVAGDLTAQDLESAREPRYASRPKWGPKLIAVTSPTDPKESSRILFSALDGKDLPMMPKYYVSYDSHLADIKQRSQHLKTLVTRRPAAKSQLQTLLTLPESQQPLWLPIKVNGGFWTALLDPTSLKPIRYLPIDPY